MVDNQYTFTAYVGSGPISITPGIPDGFGPDNTTGCECPPSPHKREAYWKRRMIRDPDNDSDCFWNLARIHGMHNYGYRQYFYTGVYGSDNRLFPWGPTDVLEPLTGVWLLDDYGIGTTVWVDDVAVGIYERDLRQPFLNDECALSRIELRDGPQTSFPPLCGSMWLQKAIGSNCSYHLPVRYVGTGMTNLDLPASQSGATWTGWCRDNPSDRDYIDGRAEGGNPHVFTTVMLEGSPCAESGWSSLYGCYKRLSDGEICDKVAVLTLQGSYITVGPCDCLWRYQNGGPNKQIDKKIMRGGYEAWEMANLGVGVAPKFWSGTCCNYDFEGPDGSGMDRYYAIVATGGGGPGSGDNVSPYWDDDRCDWIYAIREMGTGCANPNYDPFLTDGNEYSGCPTGPTYEIEESCLGNASFVTSYDMFNWECCLSGLDDTGNPAYCNALESRGALYTFNDYVCYEDGSGAVTGAAGPHWIVDDYPAFSGSGNQEGACSWTYDLQFYHPDAAGPSGVLQTGILEASISTGCADPFNP